MVTLLVYTKAIALLFYFSGFIFGIFKGGSSAGAPSARPPVCNIIIVENIVRRTRINIIIINMKCFQRVFYSHLSLQKHRVCVKGHQNNLQTSKSILRLDRAPGFTIPGSATDIEGDVLDY